MPAVDVRWATLAVPEERAAWLTDAERDRLARLRRPDDRSRFLAAHVLARIVVADRVSCPPEAVEIRQRCAWCGGPHGQPSAVVAGIVAPDLSLTHAGALVAVAVASSAVGIDLEPIDQPVAALDAIAAELPGVDEQGTALLRRWVVAEAVGKARGVGIATPEPLDHRRHHVVELDLDGHHVAAVATLGRRPSLVSVAELRWRDLSAGPAGRAPTATGRRARRAAAPPPPSPRP